MYKRQAVALDESGNVYVADPGANAVKELNLVTPPSLNFADTKVGYQSGPEPVPLRNIGNAELTFPLPPSGQNPIVSANFAVDSSTTCPTFGTLATGASCTVAVDFVPATTGSITGTAVVTDNNLNAVSYTHLDVYKRQEHTQHFLDIILQVLQHQLVFT